MADWIMGALVRHEALREFAGEYIPCPDNNAFFKLCLEGEYIDEAKAESGIKSIKEVGRDYKKLIDERLGYIYHRQAAVNVPAKVSVTELKRIVNNEIDLPQANLYAPELIKKPAFMSEKSAPDGAERGSAMHFVLQHLDLSAKLDEKNIELQIAKMTDEHVIRKEQAALADAKKIARYFESETGKRMIKSSKTVRESPFEIAIDACEMGIDGADGEQVLLQGIIDCYFYEDDGVVLLDYKTDFVKNEEDIMKIREKYKMQLDLYQKALEKITGVNVKDKILYLFSCESVIKY